MDNKFYHLHVRFRLVQSTALSLDIGQCKNAERDSVAMYLDYLHDIVAAMILASTTNLSPTLRLRTSALSKLVLRIVHEATSPGFDD